MTDYTKLIERLREYKDYIPATAETVDAIEALQKEVSTLDVLLEECKMDWSGDVTQIKAEHKREIQALQSQLGDAIQSSAHWQHQFTEAQTENDLLKGYRDRALELATAYNNAQENIEQINAHREHILAVNEKLTAQVDARGNGEPVSTGCRWCKHPAFIVGSSQKCPQCGKVFANAAPKALAPHEDTKLLDYLQARQATVEILMDGHGLSTPLFRIGGLHGTICADIRGAIGAAIESLKEPTP